ncbi:hypothetical protein [Billgrantia endophytica]|uniref:Zinc resistance-associated protein n=1 Tax=Billgrantia endophytica TaxID=2033802 RepID=A0A2N7UAQ1_9GAMM|nr:hypothetical protein [Halomonas endophytica]PMR77528.1 hypothetical protein C1H69_03115 [Halomonas endophytica]
MSLAKLVFASFLTLMMATPAVAQQQMQGAAPGPEDAVNQLDELVGLDDAQRQEISSLLSETQTSLQTKEQEAQALQQQLQGHVRADYDENAIRQDADRLGQLTGEMTADSVLLQARIEAALNQEQRDELERQVQEQEEQMRQMQEQMQQQQQQQPPPQ